jgi:single-stranded DNA-binding protein
VLNQWTAQDGQKRQKLKIVVDNLQFLEPKAGTSGGGGGSMGRSAPRSGDYDAPPADHHDEPPVGGGGGEGDIPF